MDSAAMHADQEKRGGYGRARGQEEAGRPGKRTQTETLLRASSSPPRRQHRTVMSQLPLKRCCSVSSSDVTGPVCAFLPASFAGCSAVRTKGQRPGGASGQARQYRTVASLLPDTSRLPSTATDRTVPPCRRLVASGIPADRSLKRRDK